MAPMVSLQLSEEILKEFDVIQHESGYLSRSEALRDAILRFIGLYKSRREVKGIRKAVISVIYSSDLEVLQAFSEIDHRFLNEIKTFSEHYLEDRTVRVYITVGDAGRLIDLIDAFNKIKNTRTKMMYI
ncbi:MAG: ribbon-helix-helix protein, CopG family [Promethearchaeota archaeon]